MVVAPPREASLLRKVFYSLEWTSFPWAIAHSAFVERAFSIPDRARRGLDADKSRFYYTLSNIIEVNIHPNLVGAHAPLLSLRGWIMAAHSPSLVVGTSLVLLQELCTQHAPGS